MKLLFIFVIVLLISCKKSTQNTSYPQGIYVEETLRLDTMDFTVNNLVDATAFYFDFKQQPSIILPPNPTPGFSNGYYQFQINNNNTIDLRSLLSSNSNFQNYYFNWQANNTYFEIDKFFIRPTLPTRIKFVKL